MARDRIYMNDPRPANEYDRRMQELSDLLFDIRPLDGTNLEWIYKRDGEVRRDRFPVVTHIPLINLRDEY